MFVASSSVGEIPSLQGMASKEPYVGHSSKYSFCVGCSLDNERHFLLTNLNFAHLPEVNLKSHLNASGANQYFSATTVACSFILQPYLSQICLAYVCCLSII